MSSVFCFEEELFVRVDYLSILSPIYKNHKGITLV